VSTLSTQNIPDMFVSSAANNFSMVYSDHDIAVDSSGNIHLLLHVQLNSGETLIHALSTDGGSTWAFTNLDSDMNTINNGFADPEMRLDSNERPHIMYRYNDNSVAAEDRPTQIIYRVFDGTTWSREVAFSRIGSRNAINTESSFDLDSNDNAHIAMPVEQNGSGTDASLFYINNVSGSWSAHIDLATGGTSAAAALDLDIDVDSNDRVHIVRTDRSDRTFYHTNKSGTFTEENIGGTLDWEFEGNNISVNDGGDVMINHVQEVSASDNNHTLRYFVLFNGTTTWETGLMFTGNTRTATRMALVFNNSRQIMTLFDHFRDPAGTGGNPSYGPPNNPRSAYFATATVSPPGAVETTVASITRKDPNPTNAATRRWDVTFAAAVTGVSASNFATVNGGSVAGSSVTSVTGSGTTYVVTANTGSGSGTLGLNFANDTGVTPMTSNEVFTGQIYTIDKTPPAVPTALDLAAASDVGSSNADNITNDDTPQINGNGENTSVVTLSSNLDGVIGTDTASGGTWAIITSTLQHGVHTITATATDALGNTSAASAPLIVNIDTMISTPTGLDLAASSDSAINNDDITSDNTPQITGDADANSSVALTSNLDGSVGSGTANSPFSITTSTLQDGVHSLTAVATDIAGNVSSASTPLSVTIDTMAPTISGAPAKTLIINAPPSMMSAIVNYGPVTATDINPASPSVSCAPPSGTMFNIGTTTVSCTSIDTAGNIANPSFDVIVLETLDSPGTRMLDTVSLRGDAAPGAGVDPNIAAGVTIFNHTRGYLNNNGDVIFEATLTGNPAANNVGVFSIAGATQSALAVKGAASGAGNYGTFKELAINDAGTSSLQSSIGGKFGHFVEIGGNVTKSALVGQIGGAAGGGEFISLSKPALASNGDLLSPGNMRLGVAGVTINDDTLIWSSSGGGTTLAREGDASPIAATDYGHFLNRVVASNASDRIAFSSFLLETPFDPSDNTALFIATLGAPPVAALREGDAAPGTSSNFAQFLGESVNSSGEFALRATLIGGGATSSDNEGIWSNAGGGGAPTLIAREGGIVPCLPNTLVAFDRFATLSIGDDGTVCFYAYLKDATATAVVNSSNDGSIWRYTPGTGQLHLVAREGDIANSTADAVYALITEAFACNSTSGIAFQSSLVTGIGDTISTTNSGVWLDRGTADAVPQLALRKSDMFEVAPGDTRTVTIVSIDAQSNSGKAQGGYGRAINDSGEILLKVGVSGNLSGYFKLSVSP